MGARNLAAQCMGAAAILKAIKNACNSRKVWFDQPGLCEAATEGTVTAMNASDTKQKILDAVDAGFDAQLATTRDFVAIPSTRGAEGPCQDMIGDLLRQRGYEVDDWHIDVDDLKDLRGFGPIEHDFSKARTVVGTYRPSNNAGKSLILQGHCDVVPAGPLEMWETPPFSPVDQGRQDVWPRRLRHEVRHHRRALCAGCDQGRGPEADGANSLPVRDRGGEHRRRRALDLAARLSRRRLLHSRADVRQAWCARRSA